MPTIKDLTQGVVFEGNEGDKWIIEGAVTSPDEILVTLKRLKVVEELIKET